MQEFFHCLAFFVIIIDIAVFVGETVEGNFIVAKLQGCIQDVSGLDDFPIRSDAVFINDFKPVAFAQISAEIYRIRKDFDKVGHQPPRYAVLGHGAGKRTGDNAAGAVNLIGKFIALGGNDILLFFVFGQNMANSRIRLN